MTGSARPLTFTVRSTDDQGSVTEREVEVNLVADEVGQVIKYVPTDPTETHEFAPIPFEDISEVMARLIMALPQERIVEILKKIEEVIA